MRECLLGVEGGTVRITGAFWTQAVVLSADRHICIRTNTHPSPTHCLPPSAVLTLGSKLIQIQSLQALDAELFDSSCIQ